MISDIAGQQGELGLGKAFMYWLGCLVVLAGMVYVTYTLWSAPLAYASGFYYLAAGFFLSRRVLRRLVRWLPYYYTLNNVAGAKLHFFLAWPLAYVFLFIRTAINNTL